MGVREVRPSCKSPGCTITPRDPQHAYCHKHRLLAERDDAVRQVRADLVAERAAKAEAEGRAWAASGGTTTASTRRMLASIESSAERSPEGAATAWRSVSAINANLGRAEQNIVDGIAKRHGAGVYADSAGTEYEIVQSKSSERWDSDKLLDAVDSTVPDDASNADYVAALRKHTSLDYRPYRLRALCELSDAYGSVSYGANSLRPLDEETDDILSEKHRLEEWRDAWSAERDYFAPSLPDISVGAGTRERLDALREVRSAREIVHQQMSTWSNRAVVDQRPGEYMFDEYGLPIAKVVSGMEARGPNHAVVNDALAALPDRHAIREMVTEVARVKGAKRGLKSSGLKADDFFETIPGRWRAKAAS